MPRSKGKRIVLVVVASLVVVVGAGLLFAWRRGWLHSTYIAAAADCGEVQWVPGPPVPAADRLAVEQVVAGLQVVTAMELVGPDVALVAERAGSVHLVDLATGADEPVLDIRDRVSTEFDQGLLNIAVTPDRSHLLAYHTDLEGRSTLEAFEIVDGAPVEDGSRVLLSVEQDDVYHNGGGMAWSADGALYLTVGDGGIIGDRHGRAQDPHSLLGTVLRIVPTPDAEDAYTVPADNPFVDGEDGRPEVWALGTRNPFRVTVDDATGDLWVADVGHNCEEEVTTVPAGDGGANLGWNRLEGRRGFLGGVPEGYVAPVVAYPNDGAWCSVIGGVVVHDTDLPGLEESYVFSDYCAGRLLAVDLADVDAPPRDLGVDGLQFVLGIVAGPDGSVYVLTQADGIWRLTDPPT